MFGLLTYPDEFSKAQSLKPLWYKDTTTTAAKADNNRCAVMHAYLIQSPTIKGTFSFRISLKYSIGFCEDYDRIVYDLKHGLTLVRKSDVNAVFRAAAAGAGKVSSDKISWFTPHVISADSENSSIDKTIESKVQLQLAYRTRQCDMLSILESISFTWRLSVKTAPEILRFIIV